MPSENQNQELPENSKDKSTKPIIFYEDQDSFKSIEKLKDAVEKFLQQNLISSEDIYDFCLMSELPAEGIPEPGKIYFDIYQDKSGTSKLKYVVVNNQSEAVESKLDNLDIDINDVLTKSFLNSKKTEILKAISKKKHIIDYYQIAKQDSIMAAYIYSYMVEHLESKEYKKPEAIFVAKEINILNKLIDTIANQQDSAQRLLYPKTFAAINNILYELRFLSKSQVAQVQEYFRTHDGAVKWSRKESKLPFSVIKTKDGKLIAISRTATHKVGQGSYGMVKVGQNIETGQIVAAKITHAKGMKIRQDNIAKPMFDLEVEMLDKLKQFAGSAEKAVTNNAGDFLYNKRYIFSNFFEGISLRNYFSQQQLDPSIILNNFRILLKVFTELKLIHDQDIIHGDISFNNILINPKTGELAIIDFGLAVILDATQNQTFKLKNSIYYNPNNHYMPPEADHTVLTRFIDRDSNLRNKYRTIYSTISRSSMGIRVKESDIYILGWFINASKQQIGIDLLDNDSKNILSQLFQEMMAEKMTDRPSIPKIIDVLSKEIAKLESKNSLSKSSKT